MKQIFLALMTISLIASASSFAVNPEEVMTKSVYVEMRDGVRLAVDVHFPKHHVAGVKYPVLFQLTRYWRAFANPETDKRIPLQNELDLFFIDKSYVLVKVDVRGTGASFGSRDIEYGPIEVQDSFDLVSWTVKQPWSDGSIGAYGTSYAGTAAELLVASGHPAVKAVVIGWSDFDVYRSPARPYGLMASAFIKEWSNMVALLDSNNPAIGGIVAKVDEDHDGQLRAAAVKEHENNPNVFDVVSKATFRDIDVSNGFSLQDISIMRWKNKIDETKVPMLVFASWFDSGTAAGALTRFQHFKNPQKLVIMASMHGGAAHASPYKVSGQPLPPQPSTSHQRQMQVEFFDRHLKGLDNPAAHWPNIQYFNIGEEAFRVSQKWPPNSSRWQRAYFASQGKLTFDIEENTEGADIYLIDFGVTTGASNRWTTQMGQAVLNLDNRGEMDSRMLTYTTSQLDTPLQITGSPVINLAVSSDQEDAALIVYLEDVDEQGRSRYLTEGGLRLIHRQLQKSPFNDGLPYHSYSQEDALPVKIGEMAHVRFQLWPISAQIVKGHRLRVAIAGADAGTFDPVANQGGTAIKVYRLDDNRSFIELPLLDPNAN